LLNRIVRPLLGSPASGVTMTAVISARDTSHFDRHPAGLRWAGQAMTPPDTSNCTAARVSAIGLSSRP
jgi:hypothetical protein